MSQPTIFVVTRYSSELLRGPLTFEGLISSLQSPRTSDEIYVLLESAYDDLMSVHGAFRRATGVPGIELVGVGVRQGDDWVHAGWILVLFDESRKEVSFCKLSKPSIPDRSDYVNCSIYGGVAMVPRSCIHSFEELREPLTAFLENPNQRPPGYWIDHGKVHVLVGDFYSDDISP